MLIGTVMLAVICLLLARLATSQIGGQTGDVLGSLEQSTEASLLLIAAALL
jgi:adenosylcobinamide-GDP ribazoletransferase